MKNLADKMDSTLKKRKRTVLTAKQHQILVRAFEECPFPDGEQRAALGKTLNMSSRTVQIWFQNQRQKTKNNNTEIRSSDLSDESYENIDNSRYSSFYSQRSLQTLAHVASIEYDKKFGSKDKKN